MTSLFSLTVILSLAKFILADCSTAKADDITVFIDIHSRLVNGFSDFFQYGLFVGAGTTSQNQSLWPSLTHKVTSLATHEFCSFDSSPRCANYTHGTFGHDASTTWNDQAQATTFENQSSFPNVNVTFGQDTLNIFTHFFDPSPATVHHVENQPIALLSDYNSSINPFFTAGSVGLGPNSYLLNSLFESNTIASRAYGFYLGTGYERAGGISNGSLVLGGYDSARIAGEVHQFVQTTSFAEGASPFQVRVKDITLVTGDGTPHHLISEDGGSGFDGFISTSQYPVQFPSSVTEKLAELLGAGETLSADGTLVLSNSFLGNLTVTLEGGLDVTYPAEWISNASNITPFAVSTPSPQASSQNNTSIDNTTNTTTGTDDIEPFILGAAFLHHLYMAVSYDSQPPKFFLAEANIDNTSKGVQRATLCSGDIPKAATKPQISKFVQEGMIGAILGGSIGGMAAILFAAFLVRKCMQRRASNKRWNDAALSSTSKPTAMERAKVQTSSPMRSKGKRLVAFVRTPTSPTENRRDSVYPVPKRASFTDSDTSDNDEPPKKSPVVAVKKLQSDKDIEMGEIHPAMRNTSKTSRLSTGAPISPLPYATSSSTGMSMTRNDSPVSPLVVQFNNNNNGIDSTIRTTTLNLPEQTQTQATFDSPTLGLNSANPLLAPSQAHALSTSQRPIMPALTIQTTDLQNPKLKSRTTKQIAAAAQSRSNYQQRQLSDRGLSSRSKTLLKRLSGSSAAVTASTESFQQQQEPQEHDRRQRDSTKDYLKLRDQMSPIEGRPAMGAGFRETAFRKMFPGPT